MTGQLSMPLFLKIFKMKKLFLVLLFFTGIANAQVVPLGMFHRNEVTTISYRDTETVIVEVTSATGRIWMDRNLGATQVATSSQDAAAYGHLYQWGRGADGHQIRNSTIIDLLSTSDTPGNENFIKNSTAAPFDWRSPQNDNLWQDADGTNNPCPCGFRLPTEAEWLAERAKWSSTNAAGAFASPLKLTMGGYRGNSGLFSNVNSRGFYYSSTVSGTSVRYIRFSSSVAEMLQAARSSGFTVRCIKPYASFTPTAPDAPTNVAATAGNNQATVTFSAPISDGGSTIASYIATSSPGGKTGSVTQSGSGAITVTGLTNGTPYTFTVTATNAIGTSTPSAASSAVTPATLPGVPTNVAATAGNNQATVTFEAPISDGGSTIASYIATSSPGGKTGSVTQSGSGAITVTGLTNGTAYTFTVTATNAIGTSTPSAASSSVTPVTVPGVPTNVAATAGNGQVIVTFETPISDGGSTIASYIATSSPGGKTGSVTQSGSGAITVTGLTNGTAYTFTVTATNAIGTSTPSAASSSVTPATLPGVPTNVAATAGNNQATVTFEAPISDGGSTITGYTVTSSAGDTQSGASSPITVTALTNGTVYTFTVTATNSVGTSGASSASSAVTPAAAATPKIGDFYQGGIVFYIAPTPTDLNSDGVEDIGLICAIDNQGAIIWNGGSQVDVLNARATDISAGSSNTDAIITTQGGTPATYASGLAKAYDGGGFNDWFLPSIDGLEEMYINQDIINTASEANGGAALGDTYIWSSTQYTNINAWVIGFGACHRCGGTIKTNNTNNILNVRAVRAFNSSTGTPSTAPDAPTIVTAAAGDTQATVTFTAPTSDGGSAITGYTATSTPGGFTGTLAQAAGGTITVIGLTNGTPYIFTVTATNALGTSGPSLDSSPVTPVGAPDAPTNVTAAAGDTQATVTFTAPTSDGGSAITVYTATSTPGGFTGTLDQAAGGYITVIGLTNGIAYTFTVTGTNANGSSTPSSVSNEVIPSTKPGTPTNISGAAGNGEATVTFTAPANDGGSAITGYTATSNPSGITSTVFQSGSGIITVTGLTNGTAYTFTVTATNSIGTSGASLASNVVTPAPTSSPPTNVFAVAGNREATVTFDAPTSDGGYAITGYTVTSNDGLIQNGSKSPIIVKDLVKSNLYTFTVTATNPMGTSYASSESNQITAVASPGSPILTADKTIGDRQVTLNFKAPLDDGGTPVTSYTAFCFEEDGKTLVGTISVDAANVPSTIKSIVYTGLTNGTKYGFRIIAYNSVGSSPKGTNVQYATLN
jgi:uncharacterized protein (TIGR02145 family)